MSAWFKGNNLLAPWDEIFSLWDYNYFELLYMPFICFYRRPCKYTNKNSKNRRLWECDLVFTLCVFQGSTTLFSFLKITAKQDHSKRRKTEEWRDSCHLCGVDLWNFRVTLFTNPQGGSRIAQTRRSETISNSSEKLGCEQGLLNFTSLLWTCTVTSILFMKSVKLKFFLHNSGKCVKQNSMQEEYGSWDWNSFYVGFVFVI